MDLTNQSCRMAIFTLRGHASAAARRNEDVKHPGMHSHAKRGNESNDSASQRPSEQEAAPLEDTMEKKEKLNRMRRDFFDDIDQGRLDNLPDTVRRMRKAVGLTQTEYAKLVRVAPRVLIDLERGVGNSTLKSLEKIATPFGLRVGLVRKNGDRTTDEV